MNRLINKYKYIYRYIVIIGFDGSGWVPRGSESRPDFSSSKSCRQSQRCWDHASSCHQQLGITGNHLESLEKVSSCSSCSWANFPGDLHGLYGDTSHRAGETRTHFSIELWKIVEADTGKMKSYWKHLPCIGHALLYMATCVAIQVHGNMATWHSGKRRQWRLEVAALRRGLLRITRRFSQNRKRSLENSLENSLEKLAKSSVQFLILLGSPSGKKKFWGFLDAFPGACHDLFSSFVSLQYHHFGYFWVTYLRWLRPACCEQKRLSWAGWPWFHSARPCG